MSSDCILVYPNPSLDSPNRNLGLGVLFVGAALEERGFRVEYIDTRFDTLEDFRRLLSDGTRVVGVSAMTGQQCAEAKTIFEITKAVAPDVKTVLGGVHPSMLPDESLAEPEVDFIVVGEGENTMCELVEAILGGTKKFCGIKGLGWKDGDTPVRNEKRPFAKLADLPFPLTAKNKRFFEIAARTGHFSYFTTRGCPFRCSFCYNLVFNDRRWREMPPERLDEDLRRLRKEVEFKHVYFVDDYLGHRKERISAVTEVMRRADLTWHSSIRASDINADMARILDEGNCDLLLFGIESGTERVQQGILVKDMRHGLQDVYDCVEHIRKTRITPLYSFMYNVPEETAEELESSIKLAEWIYRTDRRARIGFYAYTPYPGTPLYWQAVKKGFQAPKGLRGWAKMTLSNEMNPKLRDLYYIAGMRLRGRSGDRTDENFPGWKRLMILPFEISSRVRWKTRRFVYTRFERHMVHNLIRRASRRNR